MTLPAPDRERWLLVAAWWLTAAFAVAGAAFTLLVRGHLHAGDFVSNLGEALAGIYYACLGVLVVRRARNAIGWLLLGEGCCCVTCG